MACNTGKFIDRSPLICPAGKLFGDNQVAADCLKEYTLEDEIDALKHEEGIFEDRIRTPFKYRQPPLRNKGHAGIFTEGRPALRPPTQTRFQTLITNLKETTYESFWNKEVGKTRDPTAGLPAGMDPKGVTFGDPVIRETTMKDLINPPKGVYQVLWDSQVGHEMYKKTHNDYNPGERICRDYLKPSFNPDKRFGKQTTYDARGTWVRCACHWHKNEPVVMANDIQADLKSTWKPTLAKCLTPNENIKCVPEGHRFGKPCKREMYGMADLLKDRDCEPCLLKRDFYDWMDMLNHLRNILKRKNVFIFDIRKFYKKIVFYDKDCSGWVDKCLLYKVCDCDNVNFEHTKLEPLLTLLGILKDDKVDYRAFVDLIDVNKPMPEIIKMGDVPPNNQYYITTSRAAVCDYLIINNSGMRAAGLPSQRFDLPKISVPEGQCSADRDHLGDETGSSALLNPSIYTNYGLTHRDFFQPRTQAVIRNLFEKSGHKFSDEDFEKLWKMGVDHDKTGLVCVDTFSRLIQEVFPHELGPTTEEDKC